MNARLIVLALVIGSVLLGFAAEVGAQAAQKSAPAGGPREGIKVHGDWVIEVRNPDGTLATRRQFKNGLLGALPLSRFLARESSVGAWMVLLNPPDAGTSPCETPLGTGGCIVSEAGTGLPAESNRFDTLTVASSGPTFVLTGNFVAARAGQIGKVNTLINSCPATSAPAASCSVITGTFFTSAILASPIAVELGQIIQVTVTISFS